MTTEVKEYIERNSDLLRHNEDLVMLYTNALKKDSPDYRVLGELTTILKAAGIDVLNYTDIIPPYYFHNSLITEYTIPPHIKEIREAAFANCTQLVRLDLNKNLRLIDENAFYRVPLTSLNYPGTMSDFHKLIKLTRGWNTLSAIKEVCCTDGVLSL